MLLNFCVKFLYLSDLYESKNLPSVVDALHEFSSIVAAKADKKKVKSSEVCIAQLFTTIRAQLMVLGGCWQGPRLHHGEDWRGWGEGRSRGRCEFLAPF